MLHEQRVYETSKFRARRRLMVGPVLIKGECDEEKVICVGNVVFMFRRVLGERKTGRRDDICTVRGVFTAFRCCG